MQYSNFYKRVWLPTRQGFERALAADVPALDFHDLRHTYASLMIAANIHPNVLKDLMGHESIKVTMDTYGHLYTGASDTAVEMLDVFLSRPVGQPDDATSAGV
jgi:integrase